MNDNNDPIGITRTSNKGSSLRITLPKDVARKLDVGKNQYLGFFLKDGNIIEEF
jgi:hypothetical protein